MTRIRRINVSQVEGGNADNANINEIRPNGETAFYLDNNNKLTLMMFDGVRTHQKSKVLSPGVLYGSNADSGDGAGLDTIKLIPDAALGSDQYIVVDPTVPNHIHLRAGGTIDSSTAELYLGGENNHFRVNDNGYASIRANNSIELNVGNSNYIFSYDQMVGSSFQIPGGIQGALQPSFLSSNGLGISIDGFNTPNTVDIGNIPSSTVLRLKDGDGAGNIVVQALGTSLKLQTGNGTTWELNSNGSLTFPDATVQTTSYTGADSDSISNVVVIPEGSVTYTSSQDHTNGLAWVSSTGLLLTSSAWTDTSARDILLSMPAGTSFTVTPAGWFPMSFVATSGFVDQGNGTYLMTGTGELADNNPAGTIDFITFIAPASETTYTLSVNSSGGVVFPDATVQTTAFVQGVSVFEADGTNTSTSIALVDYNLLIITVAIGYLGSDNHTVTLPAGLGGQRLVIRNNTSLVNFIIDQGIGVSTIAPDSVAEFIYDDVVDGYWIPLYGTT